MKKFITLLFATTLLVNCTSGRAAEPGGTDQPPTPPPPEQPEKPEEKESYIEKAEKMFDLVWDLYRVDEHGLFSEYYPSDHKPNLDYFNDGEKSTQEVSFLWPMSGVFSSTVLLAELNPAKYRPYLGQMIEAVEMYRDQTRTPPGYQAYPAKFGIVDRYYDDNGLVGIDYIDSYMVTKDPLYLQRAKEVMTFIMSGWTDEWDGGVWWVEGTHNQKPGCANGKALVTALKIYEATNDTYYLELGKKFYNWIDKYLRDNENNIIFNSWLTENGGSVHRDPYTYNTGTVIQGAVRLYKATGEKAYLENAQSLAAGSHRYFFRYTTVDKAPYGPDIPWFDLVLMRGYQELYEVDRNPVYMNTMVAAIDHVMAKCRDQAGLTYKDWSGNTNEYRQPKWLLDTSCMPEFLARAGIYKGEKTINKN